MIVDYRSKRYYVGAIFTNNQMSEFLIIGKSKTSDRFFIKFMDEYGCIVECSTLSIKKGTVKNPYIPSVCGVGYIGDGEYRVSDKGVKTPAYSKWKDMLIRVYGGKFISYKNTTVSADWHNFQKFAEWFYVNGVEGWELDKDIKQQDVESKIYSKDTCVFLPKKINSFMNTKRVSNKSGFTGVSWNSEKDKWDVRINDFKETKKLLYIGRFSDLNSANQEYLNARRVQAEKAKQYAMDVGLCIEIVDLIK